uniref:Antifreeze protein n=1 Tax=Agrobacterium albertimagni TaxID=147266 RepID=A0A7C1T0T2_9HYPH
MIGMLRKIGLAAIVSVMATTGLASTASADSWGVYIEGPRHGGPGWDRPGHRPGWDRPRGGECRPHQAVEKARWNGLRRAFVADVTPRRVVVAGVRHGGRDRMVFANVRGCPVIRH